MAKQQSITTLPRSPDDDRRNRMIKYSITMGIRTICVVLCIFARGWWLLVCAVGAVAGAMLIAWLATLLFFGSVVLPYFAVVLANVSWSAPSVVRRPGSLVPLEPPQPAPEVPPGQEPPAEQP